MSVRSGDRKFSFDLLATDISGDDRRLSPISRESSATASPTRRKRRSKSKKKKPQPNGHCEEGEGKEERANGLGLGLGFTAIEEPECESSQGSSCVSYVELRQRNVSNGGLCSDMPAEEDKGKGRHGGGGVGEGMGSSSSSLDSTGKWTPPEMKEGVVRLETMESLDWKQVMAKDPNLLRGICNLDFSFIAMWTTVGFIHSKIRSRVLYACLGVT